MNATEDTSNRNYPPLNAEPSCIGLIRKALFVLNMNFYKDRVKRETKMRHLRELRDACQGFVDWYDRSWH